MAASTATINPEITELATQYVDSQRDTLIAELAERISTGIDTGVAQIKNGEYMDFDTLKNKINQKHFNK